MRFASVVLTLLVAVCAYAGAAEDPLLEMAGEPGTFHLTAEHDRETVSFEESGPRRLCLGEGEHVVRLRVAFGEEERVVGPGECTEFEAQEVRLSPEKSLDEGWLLKGKIETLREKRESSSRRDR